MKFIALILAFAFSLSAHDRICFIHIPKTGGTTLNRLFANNIDKSKIFPHQLMIKGRINPTSQEEIDDILNAHHEIDSEYVGGHFPLWFLQEKAPYFASSYFITVLRDPVERILSNYRFVLREGHFISSPLELPANTMCLMLCSDPLLTGKALLENAKQNLSQFDSILFLDDFDRGVKRLFYSLGFRLPKNIPHYNVTEKKEMSFELIEKIKELNALDIELYQYAKENFRK